MSNNCKNIWTVSSQMIVAYNAGQPLNHYMYNSIYLNSGLSKVCFGSEGNLNLPIIIIIIIIVFSVIFIQLIYNCMFYKQITVLLLRTDNYADDIASPLHCCPFHHAGDALFQASSLFNSSSSSSSVTSQTLIDLFGPHLMVSSKVFKFVFVPFLYTSALILVNSLCISLLSLNVTAALYQLSNICIAV